MGAPGCDDAPVVTVPLGPETRDFTLIVPYYENPEFFGKQLTYWSGLPEELRRHVCVMIVDDGSRTAQARDVVDSRIVACNGRLPFAMRLFRIEVDVRWNWLAARNIGAHYARTRWLMLTDMDHVLPERTLRTLVYGQHSPETIYRFSRTGAKTHPHPNSWFMTRDMYWKVGGYDEALSGHYGTDGEYRRRCAATASIRIMDVPLELHEYELDASTQRYKRKQPEDARGKQLIKARGKNWKPRTLSFPHHEVIL